jgi:hypothetical protein
MVYSVSCWLLASGFWQEAGNQKRQPVASGKEPEALNPQTIDT